MKEKLEKLCINNEKWYALLNIVALNGDKYFREKHYLFLIKKYMTDENSEAILKKLLEQKMLKRKISYECDDEIYDAELLEKKCEICGNKVLEHEYFELYSPSYLSELSAYNIQLFEKYFDSDSKIVMEDIQKNIDRVIPFVGSGISKSVGLPLWLELFKKARDKISDDYKPYFDLQYESKNVDKIINVIKEAHPLICNDKDLKKELVVPAVNKRIKNEVLLNSIIPDVLKLDAEYIITTNYDDLLEKTSQLLSLGYEESRDISSFQGFESLDETQYIFHIHGSIKNYDSMVVTNEDYANLYDSEDKKRILSGLINKHSMLFLGFSMNDTYFSDEFGKICESNKGYCTNYYVMINGDREEKDELLKTTNVRFINIKSADFDIKNQYKFMIDYILGNIYIE
ncbi:SIR2 family NAD-dependent protein deacylase [Enterococcus hirae]|uniref:SIR2 family NAD-dependent protein deacylase n=1 Tax=Enterococcus hirae TaxID=1354 RepID=UPI00259AE464|nr:SIR2 family protein [uncultured Enterococcus sp.]EMF0525542.1 SIR2 family protein [Enterococcus hirae]